MSARGCRQHMARHSMLGVGSQGTLLMAMANGLPVVSPPYHFALELLQVGHQSIHRPALGKRSNAQAHILEMLCHSSRRSCITLGGLR